MEDFIQLKKSNILKIGIKDAEGNDTGEHLEFDLEDIELPFKLSDCDKQHKRNLSELKRKFLVIDKKQDKKGNNLFSANEEAKIKAMKEFYEKEEKALDLFLGEGGTKKLLNGRNPYYTMYDDISQILEPIYPKLELNAHSIEEKIKSKYKTDKKEDNVI